MIVGFPASRMLRNECSEINSEYSLEGLLLKLKLQYFGHLMQRADSLEKTLMLGKIEVRRRRGQLFMWLDTSQEAHLGIEINPLPLPIPDALET